MMLKSIKLSVSDYGGTLHVLVLKYALAFSACEVKSTVLQLLSLLIKVYRSNKEAYHLAAYRYYCGNKQMINYN